MAVTSSGKIRITRDTLIDLPIDEFPSSPSSGQIELPSPADLRLGTKVGDGFRLLEVTAIGTTGALYEARDEASGQRLTIKLMFPSYRRSKPHESRFMWEARVAAAIHHPGCARVVAAGRDTDDSLYQVLERLHGEPLSELMSRGRLMASDALKVGKEVLAALDAVHLCGFVHRAVTPSNVFLNVMPGNVRTKLLDFGLARRVRSKKELSWLTEDGAMDSPAYMSPEQCTGNQRVTVQTDIWSVGALLFHALSGEPPFADDGLYTLLKRIAEEPARSLAEVRPDLPNDLIRCVDGALQRNPKRRWESAREMGLAIASVRLPPSVS